MEIYSNSYSDNLAKENKLGAVAARSPLSKAEIARLADIATAKQVTVEVEAAGCIVRVSPLPAEHYRGQSFVKRGGVVL